MCERGRENGIKETFYRDYTALLFSPSVSGADKWTWQRNAATERWGTWHLTAVEVIQNHFLIKFLMSPSVQLHLLIFQSRPPTPPTLIYWSQAEANVCSGRLDRWEPEGRKVESKNGNTQQQQTFGLADEHKRTWRMVERRRKNEKYVIF